MSSQNLIKYCKFLIALLAFVGQQFAHGQPIEGAAVINKAYKIQQLPNIDGVNKFSTYWPVDAVQAGKESDENVRKTRHIIGGGGLVGGFKSYGVSAPVYTVPIISQAPILTTVPVVSTFSAVPAYYGYGYPGFGAGYGAGGFVVGGVKKFAVKGVGIGGGFLVK